MADLKRDHGRRLRDHMLKQKTSTGKLLSLGTIRRELDMVRAIVELALLEFDLQGTVANPFRNLDVKRAGDLAPSIDRDAREPLPEDVLKGMRERMQGNRAGLLGATSRVLSEKTAAVQARSGIDQAVMASSDPQRRRGPNSPAVSSGQSQDWPQSGASTALRLTDAKRLVSSASVIPSSGFLRLKKAGR